MQIKVLKHFSDVRFPKYGQVIEAYTTQICFDIKYYLCSYNGIFISLKETDAEAMQAIDYLENKNGQLIFNF